MALIEIMGDRKNDGKTYRTLGAAVWRKVAAKLEDRVEGFEVSHKNTSKKWSNLKARYKGWNKRFHGVNSSGTSGYKVQFRKRKNGQHLIEIYEALQSFFSES